MNVAFITVSLVLGVAVSVLSVTPFRLPSAGLLTSGIVFVYTLFLCWNAIVSNTDLTEECNPFRGEMQEAAPEWTGVLAFFVALAVVAQAWMYASIERPRQQLRMAWASTALTATMTLL